MFVFPMVLTDDADSVSTNCTKEKKPTTQQYVKIIPEVYDEEINPIDLLKLSKRLMICTSCGNLRLID